MEAKGNTKNLIRQNAIWLVFLIEVVFFAIFSQGTFVTPGNITNILRQVSYYGIASVGMTFVILIGGIDLSIGSIITLVNMVCAYMMVNMNCHWTISVLAERQMTGELQKKDFNPDTIMTMASAIVDQAAQKEVS